MSISEYSGRQFLSIKIKLNKGNSHSYPHLFNFIQETDNIGQKRVDKKAPRPIGQTTR